MKYDLNSTSPYFIHYFFLSVGMIKIKRPESNEYERVRMKCDEPKRNWMVPFRLSGHTQAKRKPRNVSEEIFLLNAAIKVVIDWMGLVFGVRWLCVLHSCIISYVNRAWTCVINCKWMPTSRTFCSVAISEWWYVHPNEMFSRLKPFTLVTSFRSFDSIFVCFFVHDFICLFYMGTTIKLKTNKQLVALPVRNQITSTGCDPQCKRN